MNNTTEIIVPIEDKLFKLSDELVENFMGDMRIDLVDDFGSPDWDYVYNKSMFIWQVLGTVNIRYRTTYYTLTYIMDITLHREYQRIGKTGEIANYYSLGRYDSKKEYDYSTICDIARMFLFALSSSNLENINFYNNLFTTDDINGRTYRVSQNFYCMNNCSEFLNISLMNASRYRLYRLALQGGLKEMLDAYEQGVPVEDIIL